jgi:hypothetical protein
MNQVAILYPVFVQVLLTFIVAVLLAVARARAIPALRKPGGSSDLALGRVPWPEDAAKRGNSYISQFELPVLFYAVVAFALITKGADLLMVILAWLFALSRIVHAAIHIGPNRIRWRSPVFGFGIAVLMAMWVKLFVHVITRGVLV